MDTQLITLLSDGDFHSGEALGAKLGISRAAVWKRMESLVVAGVEIERVRGKGYRVPGGLQLLNEKKLAASAALPVEVLLTTGSTNAEALTRLQAGKSAPFALLAEHQSAGRGRRGRSWSSPFASSVYLSVAWRFAVGAPRLEGLSLVVGVVIAEALAAAGLGDRVTLKWPNDILIGGRKIGGVLIELSGNLEDACTAVVGIGVNGRLSEVSSAAIDQPWTDFYQAAGQSMDRTAFAADLLQRLVVALSDFSATGFGAWRERWLAFDALAGQRVTLNTVASNTVGIAEGVDHSGALLLRVNGELQPFHGGEASLRPVADSATGGERR